MIWKMMKISLDTKSYQLFYMQWVNSFNIQTFLENKTMNVLELKELRMILAF